MRNNIITSICRFMLKSLGQWTNSTIKRKIVPSKVTMISKPTSSDNKKEKEFTTQYWQEKENEYVLIIKK